MKNIVMTELLRIKAELEKIDNINKYAKINISKSEWGEESYFWLEVITYEFAASVDFNDCYCCFDMELGIDGEVDKMTPETGYFLSSNEVIQEISRLLEIHCIDRNINIDGPSILVYDKNRKAVERTYGEISEKLNSDYFGCLLFEVLHRDQYKDGYRKVYNLNNFFVRPYGDYIPEYKFQHIAHHIVDGYAFAFSCSHGLKGKAFGLYPAA